MYYWVFYSEHLNFYFVRETKEVSPPGFLESVEKECPDAKAIEFFNNIYEVAFFLAQTVDFHKQLNIKKGVDII